MRLTNIGLGLVIAIVSAGFAGGVGVKDLPAATKEGDAVSGREIYVNTCIRCHGIDGKGAQGIKLVPPPFDLPDVRIVMQWDPRHNGNPAHTLLRDLFVEASTI